MQATLQHIDPNSFLDWDAFARYESADPYDDFAWFTVTIGAEGEDGGNDFQLVVATPRAVSRVKVQHGVFPAIVVDHFDPHAVESAIRDHVSSVTGHTWEQIVEELRKALDWEYEGMAGRESKRGRS